MAVVITGAESGSPAEKLNIPAGSKLVSINGNIISDVLDYGFYSAEKRLLLEVENPDGNRRKIRVRKGEEQELGLCSSDFLMDEQHSCQNKCAFCFIDQLPGGMRDTLYFKDDDERLSFLFGNYITLTNLNGHDVQRIIDMRISPINVSVHTTDPALRCQIMGNRFAGDKLKYLYQLAEAGTALNCQIVLCRDFNDGAALEKTLADLGALWPAVQSVAVVPAGLTDHRGGLVALEPFDKASSQGVLETILRHNTAFRKQCGIGLVYPGDEWFLLADEPIPELAFYDELLQLENGVGMLALLRDEFNAALRDETKPAQPVCCDIITGEAAAKFLNCLIEKARAKLGVNVVVHAVKNRFFGGNVSVTGLLTGTDIRLGLNAKDIKGARVLLSRSVLRSEGDLLLDDATPAQLERHLQKPIRFVGDGYDLLDAILGR